MMGQTTAFFPTTPRPAPTRPPAPRARPAPAAPANFGPLSWQHTRWVLAALALILLYRAPDRLLRPQFWAEDGIIFFQQARELGWRALWTPYAGYLHLVPRLVAGAGEALPVLWLPAFYNYTALVVTLGLAALVSRHLRLETRSRAPLALALGLVPHGGELFLCLSGMQWFFAPVLALLILQRPPENARQAAWEAALLLVFGLTGPFVLLLLPLWAWRFAGYRTTRRDVALFAVSLTTAALQGWLLARSPRFETPPLARDAGAWLKALGFEFPGRLFFGDTLPHFLGRAFWLITPALVAVYALLVLAAGHRERRRLALGLLVAAALVHAATLRTVGANPLVLQPLASGTRYFYFPYVMLAWTLVVLGTREGWPRRAAGTLLGLMALASATRFCAPREPDHHWPEAARHIARGEPAIVTTPAPGPSWWFEVKPRPSRDRPGN